VVWDWNGTLFDDFDLTARIAQRTLETMGVTGVTGEDIRARFRRPFSEFYAGLFGRPVSPQEYAFIRERYELEYELELDAITLQPDAHEAMDLLAARASQSLLSMAHDEQLQQRQRRQQGRAHGAPPPCPGGGPGGHGRHR